MSDKLTPPPPHRNEEEEEEDAPHMLLEKKLVGCDSLDDRNVNKAELSAYLQAAEKNAAVPPGTPPNLPERVAAAETPPPLYLDDG
jgi:hypothetical protein